MNEKQSKSSSAEEQKEKIRKRYQGSSSELREVIPAVHQSDFYDDVPRRVAIYVRVSTDDPRQTSSYELQKNYYEKMVKKHPNWHLVDIFADEGVTGTSRKHRDAFNRMIEECYSGKIDMIVTKMVSRFSRNIVDCISIVRELAALKSPVGVFFETEYLFTLDKDAESRLIYMASMAQEESRIKSSSMNASIEMRFSNGILLTPAPLGYDNDEDGRLIINEEEAKIVRLIFFLYLYGYTCQAIAESLTEMQLRTKKGNTHWNSGSVLHILRNERYCGNVLARKTFTPNFLDHKSKKNTGQRNRYLWKEQQEPIITHDDFIAVQHLLDNAKYGNKGILPELIVITQGILNGFVLLNIHWFGFTPEDYVTASEKSIGEDSTTNSMEQYTAETGDFDLRGFEIAHSHFFDYTDKLYVTFSSQQITFSLSCIQKLGNVQYIEMLIHPEKHLLAVRTCDSKEKNAIRWAKLDNCGKYVPRVIKGAAFLKTLYTIFRWNPDYKYRLTGVRLSNETNTLLLFDVKEAALLFPEKEFQKQGNLTDAPLLPVHGKSMLAFPTVVAEHFGSNCYSASVLDSKNNGKEETFSISGLPDLNVTTSEEAADGIQDLLQEIKGDNDGT